MRMSVAKRFGSIEALRDVSLEVQSEVLRPVGPQRGGQDDDPAHDRGLGARRERRDLRRR